MHERTFLTPAEVARLLGLSRDSVYRHLRAGEIPAVRIGTAANAPLRVDERELSEYLQAHRLPTREPA